MAFNHLPVYRLWKDRAPTVGFNTELERTVIELEEYGFPVKVGNAFLQTAKTLNSAILTRVPGLAAKVLIDERYCLKSFYIHAKSCNWGPMAGFVAFFPALNKKGVSNLTFNLKAHLESEQKLSKIPGKNISSLFIPLGLTELAAQRIVNDLKTKGYFYEIDDNSAVGIIFDEGKTVLMEYYFLWQPVEIPGFSDEEICHVYHRNIYIKREKDKPYVAYLNESAPEELTFSKPEETELKFPSTVKPLGLTEDMKKKLGDSLTSGWKSLNDKDKSIPVPDTSHVKGFYPVHVAQNPIMTYGDGDPRNAITGDYDLFAVWPVGLFSRWEETIRLSEGRAPAPPAELFGGALFAPVLGKNMSLQLVHAPNVYIEVIPNFQQIAGLEDENFGNINDAVHLAAGMLNSVVYGKYDKKSPAPNVAFHSDEGGRPGVYEIEFPLAAFLPPGVKLPPASPGEKCPTTKTECALVITNVAQFMDLVMLLEGQANIPLAYGWLLHLLILAAKDETLETLSKEASGEPDLKRGKKRSDYLVARKAEGNILGDFLLETLRTRLWSLLTGYDIKQVLDMKDAAGAMDQAAKVFFSQLYSDEDVYKRMISIRTITMTPPSAK